MTSKHLADCAIEQWRASGARTTERLFDLVQFYASSYYGTPDHWNDEIRALVDHARHLASVQQFRLSQFTL